MGGFVISVVAGGCAAKASNECTSGRSCPEDGGAEAADEQPVVVVPVTGEEAGSDASADAMVDVAVESGIALESGVGGDAGPEASSATSASEISGAVAADAAVACPPGFAPTLCGAACVNTMTDVLNCGGCRQACTTSVAHAEPSCSAGACGYQCTAAYPKACNSGCVDLNADRDNCGACGNVCAGGMTCQGGGCGCPGGTHDCNGTCANDSSTASCGTSCMPCDAPANGAATCNGTSCGIACNSGFSLCGSSCVDETENGNCGGCGNTCAISCVSSACLTVTAIAAGYDHTCAVLSNGTVECWGGNDYGQLGYVAPQTCGSTPCSLSPQVVPGLTGVAAISAGQFHSCALLKNGSVECWGLDDSGQLGGPSSTSPVASSASPIVVPGISNAIAVAAGSRNTCALISGGTVECWGDNSSGQLGNGSLSLTQSTTPVAVSGLTAATAIAVGEVHACALLSDETVVCWGDNGDDELGSAPMICDAREDQCSTTPVMVTGLTGAMAIASGSGLVTCAVVGGATAECWGYLQEGLGDSGGTQESYNPITVSGTSMPGGPEVAVGDAGACILFPGIDGKVACWGNGPLGDGTADTSSILVAVSGLTNATAVAVGQAHACVLLSTGTVSCWSENVDGQLGNGTTIPSLTPTPVVW